MKVEGPANVVSASSLTTIVILLYIVTKLSPDQDMAEIVLAPTHRTEHPAPSDAKLVATLDPSISSYRSETCGSLFLKPNNGSISLLSKPADSIYTQPQIPTSHKYDGKDGLSRAPTVPLSLHKEDSSLSPKRKLIAAILRHLLTVKNHHRKSTITAIIGSGEGAHQLESQCGTSGIVVSKPPAIPHATLILEALLQSPQNVLSTKSICKHIMENYRWFSVNRHGGWQGEIFRELSENKAFEPMSIRRRGRSMARIKWKISDARREQLLHEFLHPNNPVASDRVAQWAGTLARSSSTATSTLLGSVRPESKTLSVVLGPSEISSPRATELPLTFGSPTLLKRVSELPTIQEANNTTEFGSGPSSIFTLPQRDTYSFASQATELASPSSPVLAQKVTQICELDGNNCFELAADIGNDLPESLSHHLAGPDLQPLRVDLDYTFNMSMASNSQQKCKAVMSTPLTVVRKPIASPNLSPSASSNEAVPLSGEASCLLSRHRPNWRFQNRHSWRPNVTPTHNSTEIVSNGTSELVIVAEIKEETAKPSGYRDISPSAEYSGSSAHDIAWQSLTNKPAHTNENNSQSSERDESSKDQTSNESPEASSAQSSSGTVSREPSGGDGSEEVDESDNERRRKRPRIRKPKESPTKRKFACIYHKYDPRTYSLAGDQTYRICQITGFKTISELLRHLGRVHGQWVCTKCLYSHQDEESKRNCTHPVKVEQGRSAEATWVHLWKERFPNNPAPASQTWDLSNVFAAEQHGPPAHFDANFLVQSNTTIGSGLIDLQPDHTFNARIESTSNLSNDFELKHLLIQLRAKVELLSSQINTCRCQHLQQKVHVLEEQTKSMETKLLQLTFQLSQLNLGLPAAKSMNMHPPTQNNASSSASINSSLGDDSLANPETPPELLLPGKSAGNASTECEIGYRNAGLWFDPLHNHYFTPFQLPQLMPMNVDLGPTGGQLGSSWQSGTGIWYGSEQQHSFIVR